MAKLIVIIACPELYSEPHYAGQLEYDNGTKIDKVIFYFCGAKDKKDVVPFLEDLFSMEYPPGYADFLLLVEYTRPVPMDENFLSFITRNMFRLDPNSFKCMPALMNEDRYLVLHYSE